VAVFVNCCMLAPEDSYVVASCVNFFIDLFNFIFLIGADEPVYLHKHFVKQKYHIQNVFCRILSLSLSNKNY
jgi:hypothetical protein